MSNEKYNGWSNRETWACHLWLTNSLFMYSATKNMPADRLREYCTGLSFAADEQDFVREIGSLWRVNWAEIAAALKENTDG